MRFFEKKAPSPLPKLCIICRPVNHDINILKRYPSIWRSSPSFGLTTESQGQDRHAICTRSLLEDFVFRDGRASFSLFCPSHCDFEALGSSMSSSFAVRPYLAAFAGRANASTQGHARKEIGNPRKDSDDIAMPRAKLRSLLPLGLQCAVGGS